MLLRAVKNCSDLDLLNVKKIIKIPDFECSRYIFQVFRPRPFLWINTFSGSCTILHYHLSQNEEIRKKFHEDASD